MIDTLFSVLASALSIWDHAEKDKYINQCIELKEAYYAELAKPDGQRSDAILDDCLNQLRIICDSFSGAVGAAVSGAAT